MPFAVFGLMSSSSTRGYPSQILSKVVLPEVRWLSYLIGTESWLYQIYASLENFRRESIVCQGYFWE